MTISDKTARAIGYTAQAAIVAILWAMLAGGCVNSSIVVSVLSSRHNQQAQACTTGTVATAKTENEGGAVVSSNAITAPLKGMP